MISIHSISPVLLESPARYEFAYAFKKQNRLRAQNNECPNGFGYNSQTAKRFLLLDFKDKSADTP